ncbi:hypothetical protein DFH06DRAFT_1145433 [Mycena polygramma]|nr:hypothetical protein DFH06DRAFT_1145433 [Mycena polygramma]
MMEKRVCWARGCVGCWERMVSRGIDTSSRKCHMRRKKVRARNRTRTTERKIRGFKTGDASARRKAGEPPRPQIGWIRGSGLRAASRRNQRGITVSNGGLLQINIRIEASTTKVNIDLFTIRERVQAGNVLLALKAGVSHHTVLLCLVLNADRFKRRFERGVHRAQRKNLEIPIQDDTELVMAPDSSRREILANGPREQTESVDAVLLLPPYLLNGVKLEMRTGHATSNGLRYRMHETQGGGRWRVQSLLVGGVAQRACNLDTGRRAPSESEVSLFLLPLFWRARAARLFFTTPRRAGWEEVGPPARLAPDRALVSSAFNRYCGGRWYHWCAEVGGRGQCGACTVGKR